VIGPVDSSIKSLGKVKRTTWQPPVHVFDSHLGDLHTEFTVGTLNSE